MRLLVDEMYRPTVADQLCRRGHDVSAVSERSELRALTDQEVFSVAQEERRALVTEDVVDFVPLADALSSSVPLNVDLDVVLSVLASAVCGSLRRRLRGYETATPDTRQRRFLSTGGVILNRPPIARRSDCRH